VIINIERLLQHSCICSLIDVVFRFRVQCQYISVGFIVRFHGVFVVDDDSDSEFSQLK
jgi:hypothetical protein